MQTIQYMGSKDKLLPYLSACLNHFIEDCWTTEPAPLTFFDAFAGSGRVSYHFRDRFSVISNDKLHFSKTILSAYLCTPFNVENRCRTLINQLNNLPPSYFSHTDQWFTNTYGWDWNNGKSEDANGVKKVWLTKNARKIDMIRHQIAEWKGSKHISTHEENVLLLSLILGINKVSNVVGHQNGYLKNWCTGAKRDLILEVPAIEATTNSPHQQFVGDIFDTLKHVTADIAYFDPPYGTNNKNLSVATRYSSFYHLWNTLVTNERPETFGKANKPVRTKGYTEPLERNKREVVIPKFIRLIEEVRAPVVCFSYSNKSLLTAKDFEEVFRLAGCDMDTFRLYITAHETNNQTLLASKGGEWIDRANPDAPLTEYFFIARKDSHRFNSQRRTTNADIALDIEEIPSVNKWLAKNECLKLPKNTRVYNVMDSTISPQIIDELNHLPTGGSPQCYRYERIIITILNFIFANSLRDGKKQRLNNNSQEIDIVYTNRHTKGSFFKNVVQDYPWIRMPYVVFECKNYSRDITSRELQQIFYRLRETVGYLGFIVCREVTKNNLDNVIKKLKDDFQDRKGLVIILTDEDLKDMYTNKINGREEQNIELLEDKLRSIAFR